MTGNRKGRLPARVRMIISLLLFLVMTASFFTLPGISGETARLHTLLFRVQLLPGILRMISLGTFSAFAVVLAIAAVTLIFGRAYCSSLCPLGTIQDFFIFISRKRKKNIYRGNSSRRKIIRGVLVLGAAVPAFFGFTLILGLLDPFSIYSRFLADFTRPLFNRGVNLLLPLFSTGPIYLGIEPILFALGSAAFGMAVLAAVAAAAFFKGRWYCITICPAGSLLAVPASAAVFRIRLNTAACTQCGACEKICKAGCISAKEIKVVNGDCVLCLTCLSVCPVQALSYGRRFPKQSGDRFPALFPVKKKKSPPGEEPQENLTRREFFFRSGWSVLGAGALLFTPLRRSFAMGANLEPAPLPLMGDNPLLILPPGAGNFSRYSSLCIQCHLCVSKCPQQVMRPAGLEFGPTAVLKPVLDYSLSFCEFECSVCSQVCPSGALIPLTLAEKKVTKLGNAVLENDLCVVYKDRTSCGACAEICPTTAVFMVPYEDNLTVPEVTTDYCIGCGACQMVCPVEGTKAIRVTGTRNHTRAKIRGELPSRDAGALEEKPKNQEDPFAF